MDILKMYITFIAFPLMFLGLEKIVILYILLYISH